MRASFKYIWYVCLTDVNEARLPANMKFKCESKRNATELSNFVWENKHANTETNLVCNVLDKARAYKPEAKRCLLCLTEKYHIIFSMSNLVNSRNKLVTKCRHENKFYLANLKDSITQHLNIIDDH